MVLVVSAQSITRSAAALVKGFQGSIRMSKSPVLFLTMSKVICTGKKAQKAIEHYCGIPVIGGNTSHGRDAVCHATSRGPVPDRGEGSGRGDFDTRIATITDMIGKYVDLELFQKLMKEFVQQPEEKTLFDTRVYDVKIGVALDEVFNFYYADLFDILPTAGAEYIPFSPVHYRLLMLMVI